MEYGLIVTVLCLAIVFGLLCLLIVALYLMRLFSAKSQSKVLSQSQSIVKEELTQTHEEYDQKIIAAITAAVQMMMSQQSEDKKAKFIVRSIKRI